MTPSEPFDQWQHSFHLKAVLPLAKWLGTVWHDQHQPWPILLSLPPCFPVVVVVWDLPPLLAFGCDCMIYWRLCVSAPGQAAMSRALCLPSPWAPCCHRGERPPCNSKLPINTTRVYLLNEPRVLLAVHVHPAMILCESSNIQVPPNAFHRGGFLYVIP